jgi:hypothetical protein
MEEFDYKKFLIENRLTINSRLLAEVSIDILKSQYVDTNKISQEDFDNIVDASNQKSAYATWLAKKVVDKIIKTEDVYKFKEYFPIFDKNKRLYTKNDINQYKTDSDVREFINKTIEIREKDIEVTGGESNTESLATTNEVRKLESVGIKLLGLQDGYQIFKVPQSLKNNQEGWKIYKEVLGRCAGRDKGAKIDICTMASNQYFDEYLEDGPYYVIFNMSDPQSPYQFHYESNQFMDKNDNPIV